MSLDDVRPFAAALELVPGYRNLKAPRARQKAVAPSAAARNAGGTALRGWRMRGRGAPPGEAEAEDAALYPVRLPTPPHPPAPGSLPAPAPG